MPSFKPKTTKKIKICKKASTTLDEKHHEFMTAFDFDEKNKIPNLKKERKQIREQLNEHRQQLKQYTIEEVMDLQDKEREITEEIQRLKDKKMNYLLDNSKIIFDYFENKKNISSGIESATKTGGVKNNILNSFFKIKTNPTEEVKKREINNNNIFMKYLSNIDDSFLDVNAFVHNVDICQECDKGEMISMDDEGVLICNHCAVCIPYLTESEKPSYKEPPKEVCFYAYKKINHFKEILAQFQGKETTQIPQEVLDVLKQQMKKERIELNKLNYDITKDLLKKLGYNRYYEHINFIKNKLGIKPPFISQELEETLCNFFLEIQYPYAKYCPDYRVNFLHYYYVLYKLFELLGETHYLAEIPMLKDRSKLIEQDNIWRMICEELDWEFFHTI